MELTFLASGTITEPEVRQAEVMVMRGDPALSAQEENINVELTALEPDEDSLVVSGDLFTTMVPGGSEEPVVGEGPDSVTFDGNFQATVFRGPETE